MSKFDEKLLNYTTPSGKKFELLPDEKLVIDGMDFTSTWGSMCSYIMFITNKRIILRQANVSWNSRAIESSFHADVRTLAWQDVKLIKFIHRPYFGGSTIVIDGTFKDYSDKEKTGDDYETGSITSGFGGLEYRNFNELYEGLTRTLKALSDEYGFGIYFNGKNKAWSNVSKEEAHAKQKTITKNRLTVVGAWCLVLGLGCAAITYAYSDVREENLRRREQVEQTQQIQQTQPDSVAQLDPNSIIKPIRDTTGEFDYVLPVQPPKYADTCYTTAYPGSNGLNSKEYGCNITYNDHSIDVEWSDGVTTRFNFWSDGYTIDGNGSSENATMEMVIWEGKEYYYFVAEKGASTWIPA